MEEAIGSPKSPRKLSSESRSGKSLTYKSEEKARTPSKISGDDDKNIKHFHSPNLELIEDHFGIYIDGNGDRHKVRRFTWTNGNKIEVQVINFGARIVSIKYPDRKGDVDDVVLGFDDFESYLDYKDINFGGTIGRCAGIIRKGTFMIERKIHHLNPNSGEHHQDGGWNGFHQRLWNTHINGKKVVMTLASSDQDEGYPGNVIVTVIFELTTVNEFRITMEATTAEPTIVNLSNLVYFNLGGHHSGPEETLKHILTLNCNCFTKVAQGVPTGEIMNVVHTKYDFQIPKVIGRLFGCQPEELIDQNLCVNRCMEPDNCFVARVLHPRTGRMLEIYSNQWGLRLETANNWGDGQLRIKGMHEKEPLDVKVQRCLEMARELHSSVLEELQKDCEEEYAELRDLISKIKAFDSNSALPKVPNPSVVTNTNTHTTPATSEQGQEDELCQYKISQAQANYLQRMLNRCQQYSEEDYHHMSNVLKKILVTCIVQSEIKSVDTFEEFVRPNSNDKTDQNHQEIRNPSRMSTEVHRKKYSDGRIHGKNNAIYKNHSGFALQTQNYPNAINVKNFPNCVLKPGETYRHTLVYKFWIKAGQPAKWLRRNLDLSKSHSLA